MSTFFATEALEFLEREYEIGRPKQHMKEIRNLIADIRRSIKFRLPDNGFIFSGFSGKSLDLWVVEDLSGCIRLPYKCVVLEFPIEHGEGSTAYMAVATELADENGDFAGVMVRSLERVGGKGSAWVADSTAATMRAGDAGVEVGKKRLEGLGRVAGTHSMPENERCLQDAGGIIKFLVALSCSNTQIEDQASDREKLNKKRERQGKPPFYSYKVLTIPDAGQISSGSLGGSHRSPRVHLRRGHIRRLGNKTVWVNASVVGDKSKGLVAKDYAMPMRAELRHAPH